MRATSLKLYSIEKVIIFDLFLLFFWNKDLTTERSTFCRYE